MTDAGMVAMAAGRGAGAGELSGAPGATVVRRALELRIEPGVERGNHDSIRAFTALLADDVSFVVERAGTREIRGRQRIAAMLRRGLDDWDSFAIDTAELVQRGDRVLTSGSVRAVPKRESHTVRVPVHNVWTVSEGRIERIESFATRAGAMAAVERDCR